MTTAAVASHYERLQMNTAVSGGSMERQRRLQLISQNLQRLRTSSSQFHAAAADDDDNNSSADDADQMHQFIDQHVVVY